VLEDNVLYQFFKAHGYSFKDLQAMPSRTLLNTLKSMPEFGSSDVKRFETYANWLISMGANPENLKKQKSERTIYENGLREAYHWIDKHADGKGVWDSSLIFVEPSGHTNALITKSTNTLLHPFEERTLTQKEKAYLMGIPSDYVVDDFPENVLNQNVPVNTAADMVRHAIKFLKGEAQFSDYFYLMQNNMAKTTEDPMIKSERNFYNASSLF
jgi:site-specific DNA-cytosine methylase